MGQNVLAKLGHIAPRECGLISLNVIARSNATKQSSFGNFRKKAGLLRFARNDVVGLFKNRIRIRRPGGGRDP